MGLTQFSAIQDDSDAVTTLSTLGPSGRLFLTDYTLINMLATRTSLCLSTATFLLYVGIGIVRSRCAPFMFISVSTRRL